MKNLIRFTDKDDWRLYSESQEALDSGDFYISVTKILSVAVPERLQNYMKKNTAKAQAKRLDETADIGTRIHELVEKDLKGEEVIPQEDTAKAFDLWTVLRHKHEIEAKYTEQLVYSELGYAGTADIMGTFDDKLCLMDIKTGWYSIKAGWQLAAYREAAINLGLLPPDAGQVGINIKRDGSVGKPYVYEHYDFCYKTFLACLQIFKGLYWNKLDKMNWKYLKTEVI